MSVWCWLCMRHEVPVALELCDKCKKAEYRRNYNAENKDPSIQTSERAHRDWRARLEAADWQQMLPFRNNRRNRPGAE